LASSEIGVDFPMMQQDACLFWPVDDLADSFRDGIGSPERVIGGARTLFEAPPGIVGGFALGTTFGLV
jgi:hypothetical protein